MTKTESNKRYLARKKAKEEAAMFEAALEAPASTQTVEVEKEPEWTAGSIMPYAHPSNLDPEEKEFLAPTNTDFDSDDWEPYAPKPDNVPLAVGETQETAIKPGGWSYIPITADAAPKEPAQDVLKAGDPLEAPEIALEDVAPPSGHSLPQDTVERLQHAVDAIEWLAKQTRNIPPKTKEILRLRRDRIKELIRLLS